MHTLVLNSDMTPERVRSWQEAICLVLKGRAECLVAYEVYQLQNGDVVEIPAVVRLKRHYKKNGKSSLKFSRKGVFARDQYCCQYCGGAKSARELTLDHVVPRRQGGRTEWSNITTACRHCNHQKGGHTPEQAGMRLLSQPKRPNFLHWHLTFLSEWKTLPTEWLSFLHGVSGDTPR